MSYKKACVKNYNQKLQMLWDKNINKSEILVKWII